MPTEVFEGVSAFLSDMTRLLGRLRVSPEQMTFEPHGWMNDAMNVTAPVGVSQPQAFRDVLVIRPRLGMSAGLSVSDGERVAIVRVNRKLITKIVNCLEANGFRPWLDQPVVGIGESVGSTTELRRRLRQLGAL